MASPIHSSSSLGFPESGHYSLFVEDDLKSTSTPNIDSTAQYAGEGNDNSSAVIFRKGAPSYPSYHRQSLPPSIDRGGGSARTVRVISQGSPPVSPDLKFTRVAKQTWKNPKKIIEDDLSSSASTGNVTRGNLILPGSTNLAASSLHSFGSSDSFSYNSRKSFFEKFKKSSAVSPLAAATINTVPPPAKDVEERMIKKSDSEISPNIVVAKPDDDLAAEAGEAWTATKSTLAYKQQLKITGPLKCGQLDVIRRTARKNRQSPMSSFILDSNLLDVSQKLFHSLL